MTIQLESFAPSAFWWRDTAAAVSEIRTNIRAMESLFVATYNKALKQDNVSSYEKMHMQTAFLILERCIGNVEPLHEWFQNSLTLCLSEISVDQQEELVRKLNTLWGVFGSLVAPLKGLHPKYWNSKNLCNDFPIILSQCNFFIPEDKVLIKLSIDTVCRELKYILSTDEYVQGLQSKGF